MPPVLELEHVTVEYGSRSGLRRTDGVRAVAGVSFRIEPGEFLGLVGESGSGKSSIANAVLGLTPVSAGHLRLNGAELTALRGRAARHARRPAQLIMQDPFEALDPHMTVGQLMEEPFLVHRLQKSRQARIARMHTALEEVGLAPAAEFSRRYPHELSGGQRQRVCIAACLVVSPALLIADEPVSMLDVSVRAGVLHLLDGLRASSSMSVLMITHDLPTAAAFCDRLIVMREGSIVETGSASAVIANPQHPYTRELIAATPRLRRASRGGAPRHCPATPKRARLLPTSPYDDPADITPTERSASYHEDREAGG
jgi:peptide/nickel transport system ATP-binding protein